jgi:head-tail adaptor
MSEMVCGGWQAPEQMIAEVESVQAGIVHTAAVGYFFDVHAAIRVIYRSRDPNIGRKPMYHFDRHGVPVRLRSTSELIRESPLPRRQVQLAGTCVL